MPNAVTSKILAAVVLQTFSQSEQPDEECLLQNHVRASTSSLDLHEEFADYVRSHGKQYEVGTEEFKKRYDIFTKRFQHVQAQNQRKNALWTASLNTYTDRTEEELAQLQGWRGYTQSAGHVARQLPSREQFSLTQARNLVVPESISWHNLSSVKASIDQGACGSCWAVAAALTLQANAENACRDRSFSAQEIVSCVENPHHCGGKGGCHGATVELAMQYVIEHGLSTKDDWPYSATDETCKKGASFLDESPHRRSLQDVKDVNVEGLHVATTANNLAASFGLLAWEKLPANRYQPVLAAVAQHGPVAVSVAASLWFAYRRGIFDSCVKDAEVNHAVTLIGYGKDGHHKYWTIKNSWGNHWGENGIIRLYRSDDEEGEDMCGTDHKPEIGTGCDGGPKEVRVCGSCGILYDTVVPHFKSAC